MPPMSDTVPLPTTVPVMPLTGVLLFPNALLPLHIFEPRFREMLAHALDDDRMLCVALVRPERSQWRTSDDFYEVSTVGLIRACVGRSDGTSDLILQGIHRVKFSEFEQEAPFPIARIKPLETRSTPPSRPMRSPPRCWNFTPSSETAGASCRKKSIVT